MVALCFFCFFLETGGDARVCVSFFVECIFVAVCICNKKYIDILTSIQISIYMQLYCNCIDMKFEMCKQTSLLFQI